MPTYGRYDVTFDHGKGARIYDDAGKEYLDALCGLAVTGLGHAHPGVTKAIADQAGQLLHTSNLYGIANQQRLAERLVALSGMDNVFFGNSGAEANEAAIKLARLYGHSKGVAAPAVVVVDDSFHGRTMATLTATGNRKVQAGFEPLLSGFVRAPYNDVSAIRTIAANDKNVVAVLVEPILGEGGIRIPGDDYLPELRALCDDHGWLLMLDEVQTGNGRSGRYFCYQHTDILPDVVTTAKGLGNGVPIGACLARGKAAEILVPGTHASTFGGNPLVCAAANAVLDELEGGLIERAAELGDRFLAGLREGLRGNNQVKEIRGKGLLLAVELHQQCTQLAQEALDRGLLLNVAAGNVVRLLPPLILTDDEADEVVGIVVDLVNGLA
ncbi:MAG: aspartate aminotransferase family protein [Gammaproteobacteria bacterium]|nr:aspartate aminotransferase family protein [Gammaproteobacteria bacterium]MYE81754.1 aspartate aminotransferase family protein [Gammaproteobacteria bacterium]